MPMPMAFLVIWLEFQNSWQLSSLLAGDHWSTTKFGTYQGSTTVLLCAKFRCDRTSVYKRILIEF